MLLPIHVAAGGLALVLGAIALSVKKGGTVHRRSGLLFVYAMLVMAGTAAVLGNAIGGLMSGYFVGTALTTVRPVSRWTRRLNAVALTTAVGLALLAIVGGVKNVSNPGLSPGGVPFRMIGVMSFLLTARLRRRDRPSSTTGDNLRPSY